MQPSVALQEALVGRYTIHGELGRGGMGIVYLAHDAMLDRMVALKLLPPRAGGPDWRARFYQEARIAARLSHPNIVPIHAVEQVKDFAFFTMPFVAGETLGHRVREHGAMPVADVVRMLHPIARAVAYAHAQGVVHRDLKPDNILIEAGTGRPMILDFGIAQRRAIAEDDDGYLRGTLAFLSPERVKGRPADARSDIYALGITAFIAAAGRLPFKPTHPDEIVQAHYRLAVPTLDVRGQDGDATLARVVARCLAENPGERFQSAEELARALEAAPELRGDTPVPLRLFVKHSAGVPTVGLIRAVREARRAGFGVQDLVEVLRDDLDRRRQELTFELGAEHARRGDTARRVAYGGLGLMGVATAWLATGLVGANAALAALLLGVPITMVGGLASVVRSHAPRQGLAGARWLRFWSGPAGTLVARLAGLDPGTATALAGARMVVDQAPEVMRLMDSQIARIRNWLASPEATDGDDASDTQWLTANLTAMESLRARIAGAQGDSATPGGLTADLAAARRVCEMVELAIGTRTAASDMESRKDTDPSHLGRETPSITFLPWSS